MQLFHRRINVLVWTLAAVAFAQPAWAERPVTSKLLPKNTLAYVGVANAKEMSARLQKTAMGQMLADPQLKPLVDDLYGTVGTLFGRVQDQVGVSLDEIWSIPQGELALAVVGAPEGESKPPAMVLLIEARDGLPALMKMVEKGTAALEREGGVKNTEAVGETQLIVFDLPRNETQKLAYCTKDGVLLIVSDVDLAKKLLAVWNGEKAESLSENDHYAAIMRRCRGDKGEEPQLTWFVDPIAALKNIGQSNNGVAAALAFLPVVGLDGLHGMGGSVALATENFDVVSHLHVLLDSPRDGVIEALALGGGDITPERWVPSEAASYMTLHWDVSKTYNTIAKLIDSFQGDGSTSRQAQRGLDRVGISLENELLPAFDGRFTLFSLIEQPVTATSNANVVGVKLKDAAKFQEVFDKLVGRFEGNLTKQAFGGKTYYKTNRPEPAADGEERPRRRGPLAAMQPCFAILGEYLIVTDRPSLMEKAIITEGGDASSSLASNIEYKLIASKIGRHTGESKPGMITFNRPEEGLRFVYDLATSEQARDGLKRGAENNEFFKSLNDALDKNPLPPFKVLAQYLAPAGGVLTDDETGFHYTSFNLKRKAD